MNDAPKEILQVHLDGLACRNNIRLLTAGGHSPDDHHHERFHLFLQFPDLLFDSCGILVKAYSFRSLCTRRLFEHLPRTPE